MCNTLRLQTWLLWGANNPARRQTITTLVMSAINTNQYRDTMGAYRMCILTQNEVREGWKEARLPRRDICPEF